MHVITRKRLNEFALKYQETKSALARWYQIIKAGKFNSLSSCVENFPVLTKLITLPYLILVETKSG